MKRDRLYAVHIIDSIEIVQRWIENEPDGFFANQMMQEAVVRRLQTLSESSKRLSDTAKSAHPEVEWKQIADFRNVLVHNYMELDLDLIWQIIVTKLPSLLVATRSILAEMT